MSVTSPVTSNILSHSGDTFVSNGSDVIRQAFGSPGRVLMQTDEVAVTSGQMYSSVPYQAVHGLTYQNAAGDVTNDLDIGGGGGMDDTQAYWITVASLTKRSDATFVAGTGGGMLDAGVVGNSDYYLFAIANPTTLATDYLCSLSSTAPTMPAGYTYKRLFGWFKRSGAAIVLMKTFQMEGGGLMLLWAAPTLDINLSATLTTARRTDAVKTPQNLETIAILNVNLYDASAPFIAWLYCPDQADQAPGNTTTAPLSNFASSPAGATLSCGQVEIRTSNTGTIAARADLATVDQYSVSTLGFKWGRR
jgi:hypothetical protein